MGLGWLEGRPDEEGERTGKRVLGWLGWLEGRPGGTGGKDWEGGVGGGLGGRKKAGGGGGRGGGGGGGKDWEVGCRGRSWWQEEDVGVGPEAERALGGGRRRKLGLDKRTCVW